MRKSVGAGLSALAVTVAVLSGCSDRSSDTQSVDAPANEAAPAPSADKAVRGASASEEAPLGLATGQGVVGGQPATNTPAVPSALTNRKIIRNAEITIEVKNVPDAIVKLRNLVATTGGFLASEQATYGLTDQVSLTFRVPVEQFDVALSRLSKIGSVVSTNVSSEEVTAQFRDIESRLRSKKLSAERLRQLLMKAARPGDILEIENELSNREADIESMQGQLNVLSDQSALSTIRVQVVGKGESTVVEVPKKQDPSFSRAWRRSVRGVGDIVQGLAAATGAVLPFLPFLAAIAGILVVINRRARKAP